MSKKIKNAHRRALKNERLATSALPFVGWPAFPAAADALTLALLHQLEQSEWWLPERLRAYQFSQLLILLNFAREKSLYYRDLLDGIELNNPRDLADNIWQNIPLTRRVDLQTNSEQMRCKDLPQDHLPVTEHTTSGSTGNPVTFLTNPVTGIFHNALNLRLHFWHSRDLSSCVTSIRAGGPSYSEEAKPRGWARGYRTGPMYSLDIQTPADVQLEWIRNHKPDRLVTYPSNVLQLAEASINEGVGIPTLKEIGTLGEVVNDRVREAARRAWGVPVVDAYSCSEVGFLAIQCPERDDIYHVQSESVLLEIIDENGRACKVGELGRVVITDLHNFAQPLIRYEIGDYAEAGAPCSCGRGLPTLRRIVGRSRNLLMLKGGRRILPNFRIRQWPSIAPISQAQIVQKSVEHIEVRAVCHRDLSAEEESRLSEYIRGTLGIPLRITFVYLNEILRPSSGKIEDFICLVAKEEG
jgi:phenylacetate-CoA ligase